VKKIRSYTFFYFFIKVFVFIISLYALIILLDAKKEWMDRFYLAFSTGNGPVVFLFLFVFMFVNIGLEAFKWKRLLHSIESISFMKALMAVYSGICAGLITPHSIGDYIGRVFFVKNTKRFESIGSILFSRLSQLFITCITGIIAACYFLWKIELDNRIFSLILISIISIVVFYVSWEKRTYLLDKMQRLPLLNKIEFWFDHIRTYSSTLFYQTLFLSALRYAVFLSQFVVLLIFFGIKLPLELLIVGGIFTFFVKSLIPTFFDLGIRELAAVYFFSQFEIPQEPVILASLSLWFFNLIIPSFIGLFCMFKIER
jgi:uncharacterized membrane protein YbhN (UPF0104 family)